MKSQGRMEIVTQAHGKSAARAAADREMAAAVSEEIERLARREAAKNGVDLTARNGLMGAIMRVMSRKEMMAEAARAARERLERDGKVQKEDPKVVRHPGRAAGA